MVSSVAREGETRSVASLFAFFALAFVWSWTFWLLAPLTKADYPRVAGGFMLAGGLGPSLAALAVVAYMSGAAGLRRWLVSCVQWRIGGRRFLLAIFLPAALMGLAALIHRAGGGTLPSSPAAGHIGMAVVNVVLIFFIGGPLGEEFGWRGYALPALQARWGWRMASLLLGLVWAVWHLPLFYSAGTVQSQLSVGWYALSLVASSVVFAWLFNRSQGSLLPVLLLHTSVNAWPMLIPVMVLPDGTNLQPFQIVVVLLVLSAGTLLCRRNARVCKKYV